MSQFFETVTEYMAGAADFRNMAVSKIASLEKENKALRQNRVTAVAFKELVAKLASAGLIDQPNRAYFDKNTTNHNVGQQTSRLSALLTKAGTTKQADAPSTYVVKKQSRIKTEDEASRQLRARLQDIRPTI